MVSGPAAPATANGAEIVFSLSSSASVTVQVLNVAGRVVATPLRAELRPAGLQRISWSGRTDTGTQAPDGRYLVRVTARSDEGHGSATALCPLRLGRQ
jgi:flagellar hook assembly protein FlgD